MRKVKVKQLAMALALAFSMQSALADTLKYLGPAYGFVSTTGVVTSPAAITSTPAAGGFLMQNQSQPAPNSFLAWCLDVQGWLTSPATYMLEAGAAFYTDTKVNALERLATAVLSSVDTKAESGAFQLAVWEIVNESAGPYGLGVGNFQVATASDGALDIANGWLSNLNNGNFSANTMTLSVWKDVNNMTQDLGVFTTPIPEPEIYAMMGIGLGLMGFVARRRKQKLAA